MDIRALLGIFNYGLVLIYGLFLSTGIAGGGRSLQQKRLIVIACPLFLMIQSICWLLWGTTAVKAFYPLIVHLPLVLIIVFVLKQRVGVALVSVVTAYLCCQLPRWVNLMVTAVTGSALAGEISYTLFIGPIFFLLNRFFVRAAHNAMTYSTQSLVLFGSLPTAYYLFDYATAVYSDVLYTEIQALNEFLPTVLIVFYVIYLATYHAQTQKQTHAELQKSVLEFELKQSRMEIESLRRIEKQMAIYTHDMRHHLIVLDGFLASNNMEQAEQFIKKIQVDLEAITPRRFCENEIVNLVCSAYLDKAEAAGVRMQVETKLPNGLFLSDTELCSVLSNGLENALHAAALQENADKRWISLYCGIRLNKLLIEIKNSYAGQVAMQNGLPVSGQEGHGYGTSSIRSIAERYHGLCAFEAKDGVFVLRMALPVQNKEPEHV